MAERLSMRELKTLTKGKYTLRHTWFDEIFPPSEMMEIIRTEEDGMRTHIPFVPPIKVTNYDKGSHLFQPTKYTDEEYQSILDERSEE